MLHRGLQNRKSGCGIFLFLCVSAHMESIGLLKSGAADHQGVMDTSCSMASMPSVGSTAELIFGGFLSQANLWHRALAGLCSGIGNGDKRKRQMADNMKNCGKICGCMLQC